MPKDLEKKKKKAIEGAEPTKKTTVKQKAEAAGFGYADIDVYEALICFLRLSH